MFVLGFDFGFKYIGVAIGQLLTCTASPLFSILVKKMDFEVQHVLNVFDLWHPTYVIIGYPISDQYDNSIILDKIDFFVFKFRSIRFVPIIFVNENLSTWYARRLMFVKKSNFSNNDFFNINALSAVILIEQWFLDNY